MEKKRGLNKEYSCAAFLQSYSSHSLRSWQGYEPQILNFNVAWACSMEDHNALRVCAPRFVAM